MNGIERRGVSPWAAVFFVLVTLLVAVPAVGYVYLRYGHVPVAVNDPAFPYEEKIVHVPLEARIDREMPQSSPVPVNEATLTDGARVYKQQCAMCHGIPNHAAALGANIYPMAPQLWQKHGHDGVVGVSDDPAGKSYWQVKNGIRLTAMPSFQKTLTDTEMWEVSNLVSVADKPMPAGAQAYLVP